MKYEVLTIFDINYNSITECGAKFNSKEEMIQWLHNELKDEFYINYHAVGYSENGVVFEISRLNIENYQKK